MNKKCELKAVGLVLRSVIFFIPKSIFELQELSEAKTEEEIHSFTNFICLVHLTRDVPRYA